MRRMLVAMLAASSGCTLFTDLSGLTGPPIVSNDGGNPSDAGLGDDRSSTNDSESGAGDAPTTQGPLRFVQSASATTTQTSLTLKPVLAPTAAGNLLVVGVTIDSNSNATVASVTDDAPGGANTYLSANQRSVDTACDDVAEIWYARDIHAGARSLTVTASAAVRMDVWVLEFAGLDRTNPLDTGGATSNQPTSTVVTAPAVAPTSPNAVVISTACTCGSITGVKAGNPFIGLGVQTGENTAYVITNTAGSYAAVWNANNATWNASTVAFK